MTRVHLSITTPDLEATTAFYTKLLGEPDKVRPGYVRFAPDQVPILLSLMPGEPSVHHLGVRMDEVSQTKEAWNRLVASGLQPTTEQEVTCCWATQNKAWITDPDGRSWELYTVTDDAPGQAQDRPTACCA
jgi:catechol 2,3-dioxygenase-like lactoylglutathione lyase family enzyme